MSHGYPVPSDPSRDERQGSHRLRPDRHGQDRRVLYSPRHAPEGETSVDRARTRPYPGARGPDRRLLESSDEILARAPLRLSHRRRFVSYADESSRQAPSPAHRDAGPPPRPSPAENG